MINISTLGILSIALLASFASWATYMDILPFITPVTIAVYLLMCLSLFYVVNNATDLLNKTDLILCFYVTFELISYFWSLDNTNWPNFIYWWFLCAATYIGSRIFLNQSNYFQLVVVAAIIGALASTFQLQERRSGEITLNTDFVRSSVEGHNANFTAYVLAETGFLIAACLTIFNYNYIYRIIMYSSYGIILYQVTKLDTRGAVLSLLLVIFVYIIRQFLNKSLVIILILTLIGFGLFNMTEMADLLKEFSGIISNREGLSDRLNIWQSARDFISEYPILGGGAGAFLSIAGVGAHNLVFSILLDVGILGFIVFIIFIFSYSQKFFNSTKRGNQSAVLIMLLSACLLPISLSGHIELSPFTWLVLAFAYNLNEFNIHDAKPFSKKC